MSNKKFPALRAGLRGNGRDFMCTVELDGGDETAPVVQFVADWREGVDPKALSNLFAAAPEMLEKLKWWVGTCMICSFDKPAPQDFSCEICGSTRQLIAKAEGEEK